MSTLLQLTIRGLTIVVALTLANAAAPVAAVGQLPVPPGRPISVPGLRAFGMRDLDAGSFHTCGIDRGGRAWCWGLNDRGQIGRGTTGGTEPRPIAVGSVFHSYRQISAGGSGLPVPNNPGGGARFESHTCAVNAAGAIDCWGANGFGQLGNGSFDDADLPIRVMLPGVEFREVSAGGLHTCALSADFEVYCWGANGRGQLGADTGFRSTPLPVRVFNVGTFTSLSAGGFFTCGSNPDATICWGDNRWGQLGSGTTGGFSILPLTVSASVDGVSAGFEHACAIGISNEARCWGRADLLQLGSTLALETCLGIDCSGSPLEITGFWQLRQVSAGGTHTCGLTLNDLVLCWGHNESGELGIGVRSPAEFPNDTTVLASETTLPGRSGLTLRVEWRGREVTAGGNHGCAIAQNGAPFCWGRNDVGQVGAGPALFNHLRPVEIER